MNASRSVWADRPTPPRSTARRAERIFKSQVSSFKSQLSTLNSHGFNSRPLCVRFPSDPMSGENEVRIVNGETNRPLALDRELDPYARRAGRREFARRTLGQPAFCCACALEPELSFCAIDDDLLRETGPIGVGPHEGIELGIRQRRR